MTPTAKEIMIRKKISLWLWRLSRLLIFRGQGQHLGFCFFFFSFLLSWKHPCASSHAGKDVAANNTATPFQWSGLFRRTTLPHRTLESNSYWPDYPSPSVEIGLNLLNESRCSLDQTSPAWPLARPGPAAAWIKPLQHGSLPSLAALWMK